MFATGSSTQARFIVVGFFLFWLWGARLNLSLPCVARITISRRSKFQATGFEAGWTTWSRQIVVAIGFSVVFTIKFLFAFVTRLTSNRTMFLSISFVVIFIIVVVKVVVSELFSVF